MAYDLHLQSVRPVPLSLIRIQTADVDLSTRLCMPYQRIGSLCIFQSVLISWMEYELWSAKCLGRDFMVVSGRGHWILGIATLANINLYSYTGKATRLQLIIELCSECLQGRSKFWRETMYSYVIVLTTVIIRHDCWSCDCLLGHITTDITIIPWSRFEVHTQPPSHEYWKDC